MNIFQKFVLLTEEKNIPFTVNFELTHRCNLRCIHCYLNTAKTQNFRKDVKNCELTTDEIKDILDQLAEAGALWLVFTGGEIFLREDFFEIAEYAHKKSFLLTIFTNGTLLDENKINRLTSLPIYSVQISLYGAFPETHDSITQVNGSFVRTIQAVKWLKKEKIKVVLKTVLMKKNFTQYQEIIRLNKSLGTLWQLDPWITPKNDGERKPLHLRISKKNLREVFSDKDYFPKDKFAPQGEKRFLCSAGKNLVATSPYGDVYPCLMWVNKVGNLREKRFAEIWRNSPELKSLRGIKFADLRTCKTCSLVPYCVRCPGLSDLEDGNFLGASRIACQTAEVIRERVRCRVREKF